MAHALWQALTCSFYRRLTFVIKGFYTL
jgi:hypothetical protein